MHQGHVILGEWEDVALRHGADLKGHRVEIRVIDQVHPAEKSRMIFEGMFPQLADITEAEIKAAEWQCVRDDL